MDRIKAVVRDENNALLAKGYLSETIGKTVTFFLNRAKPVSFTKGQFVRVTTYEPNRGLNVFTGIFKQMDERKVIFEHFEPEGFIDRRFDLKIPVSYNVFIIHGFSDTSGNKAEQKVEVRLRDISAGGICFITDADYNPSDEYSFIFDRGRETLLLPFHILRKEKSATGQNIYGCSFYNIPPQYEQVIREYVFSRQLNMFA